MRHRFEFFTVSMLSSAHNLISFLVLQVVRSITPHLAEPLRPQLLSLLPCILGCVRHLHVAVRLAAARCITSMAKSLADDVMVLVIENVIPMLSDLSSVCARQGAGMLLSLLVQGLAVELVPYAPFLVVPLLKCMSDPDGSVYSQNALGNEAIQLFAELTTSGCGLTPNHFMLSSVLSACASVVRHLKSIQ